jgi:hypothetical protein
VTFTSLGEVTLGAVVPIALTATGAATASLSVQLPQLQTKLAALIQLQARVALTPPSIVASIQSIAVLTASLQAALAVGAPSLPIEVSALLAVVAEISATIGSLTAQLGIVAGIEAQLGGASVHLLRYDGTVTGLVPTGIPGISGSANINALLTVAASSISWEAMQAVFKTE